MYEHNQKNVPAWQPLGLFKEHQKSLRAYVRCRLNSDRLRDVTRTFVAAIRPQLLEALPQKRTGRWCLLDEICAMACGTVLSDGLGITMAVL